MQRSTRRFGGQIWLEARQTGDELMIAVRDTGEGILAEMQQQVFEMFVQGRTDGGNSGLGIGLTLVKSLVELHEGRIELESGGDGQGTTVTIHLPIGTADAADMQVEPADTTDPSGISVLVVDDRRAAADMLGRLLSALGCTVHVVYDGQAALQAGKVHHPEVIFLDIGMPGMDGLETAKQIRKEPWGRATTLIALTGWGQDQDRRLTQEAGFDHHLVKPPEISALRQLLARARAPRSNG
jgi:CheY-like chemotaxis protein